MGDVSISDLTYGIALVLLGGAAVVSLIAAGFVLSSSDNVLMAGGLLLTSVFNAGLLWILLRRKKTNIPPNDAPR